MLLWPLVPVALCLSLCHLYFLHILLLPTRLVLPSFLSVPFVFPIFISYFMTFSFSLFFFILFPYFILYSVLIKFVAVEVTLVTRSFAVPIFACPPVFFYILVNISILSAVKF
jgi:hypothetical protein